MIIVREKSKQISNPLFKPLELIQIDTIQFQLFYSLEIYELFANILKFNFIDHVEDSIGLSLDSNEQ